jgi:hypothetical protein
MSNSFRNFVLFLILLGMVGLPVIWAVESATRGSASYDARLEQTVEFYKPKLPIEIDENVTFIDIEKQERDLVYSYEVNVSVSKLMEMESYFTKRDQFDFCNSGNLLEFKTANVRAIALYKSIQENKFYFKTTSSAEGCEYEIKSNNVYAQSISPFEEIDLQNEYQNFFTPIVVNDKFSIIKLGRFYNIVEMKLPAEEIVEAPKVAGLEVLAMACNYNESGRYQIFIKPVDEIEPVISYVISTKNCLSKHVEFKHIFPGEKQIYDRFEK